MLQVKVLFNYAGVEYVLNQSEGGLTKTNKTGKSPPWDNQPNQGGLPQTPGKKLMSTFACFCCIFQRYDSALSLDQRYSHIIFHVALVEHIKESSRADHDQGRENDAVEYSLRIQNITKKSWTKNLNMCRRIHLNEGNNCIGENFTTAFLPWTCFGSAGLCCWWQWMRISIRLSY